MRGAVAGGLILLAALFGVTGCGGEDADDAGGSGAEASVVLDDEVVAAGETLTARVRNGSSEAISYGLDYRLQHEADGEFTEVKLPNRAVIQIALVADPGETGPPVEVQVPADAEPGRWRVILGPVGTSEPLSAEFEVQ